MKKVVVAFGTRPEAIKVAPVIKELKKRGIFQTFVCLSGQHNELLASVLKTFAILPDYNLSIMAENQTLFDITTKVLNGFKGILETVQPDIVLVHGDTTTTFASGLAAFYKSVPVGHIEAGLRTFDLKSPFPEEFNRQCVDIFSTYDFCPTVEAKNNLLKTGKSPQHIYVTGNTAIDALNLTFDPNYQSPIMNWANGRKIIVLTCHRRENIGERMAAIFSAINDVAKTHPEVCVIYPMHPNPLVRAAAKSFLTASNICLTEPMEVFDFHNLLHHSFAILTDSGGIQEEAPSLGKPVLVLRDVTERPEGVKAGTLFLAGVSYDSVFLAFKRLLEDPLFFAKMAGAKNPYGDGHASERICEILEHDFA